MLSILASSGASSAAGMGGMILWLVILFAFMYFFMIRPQKKETQKKNAMLSELATGDTVLTTSGFYGTVIDITDDTVIVEFGSNKNCRIPVHKNAIAEIEKAGSAVVKDEEEDTPVKEEKKEEAKEGKKIKVWFGLKKKKKKN